MSFTSNYVFQNMSRIGLDNCFSQIRDVENQNYGNYTVTNYFANDCRMMKPIELATSQSGVNYSGGYGMGAGGCNVDDSSKIYIGTINTSNKCRISLQERPFSTVPYLGRGSVDPMLELQMQTGEAITNKKSVNALGQTSTFSYYPPILNNASQQRREEYINALYSNPSSLDSRNLYRDVCMQPQKRRG